MENKQKYVSFVLIILVIILGAFLVWRGKKVDAPADVTNDLKQEPFLLKVVPNTGKKSETPVNGMPTGLTKEQKDTLAKLQKAADARDYEGFALALLEVYKNKWGEVDEFEKTESEFYMYTYDTYFMKGDLVNSLKFSTIVYNKVSEAWRFRYLRILTLEKYGRNAFNSGDLQTAENYANQILRMMFRLEGSNLLADVYITKIKDNIKDNKIDLAKQNLGFIWDYEVSADRRTILTNLKTQLGM